MTSVGDISAALAYQVKKEIAENFFGTRKALEEEREDLITQMGRLQKNWKGEVLPFLKRMVYFLVDRETGIQFVRLIQQEAWLGSLITSTEDQEAQPMAAHGTPALAFTAKGKYANLILSLYRNAEAKARSLIPAYSLLLKKADRFNEELAGFQARFNLADILSFIKSIENQNDLKGVLGDNSDLRTLPALEKAMVIKPLRFGKEEENLIQPLPLLTEIQKPLSNLISQAFQRHGLEIKKRLRAG
jgi:hypothetical protein